MSDLMAMPLSPTLLGELSLDTTQSFYQAEGDFAQALANANIELVSSEFQTITPNHPQLASLEPQVEAITEFASQPMDDPAALLDVTAEQTENVIVHEPSADKSSSVIASEYVELATERQPIAAAPLLTPSAQEPSLNDTTATALASSMLTEQTAVVFETTELELVELNTSQSDAADLLVEFDILAQVKRQFDDAIIAPTVARVPLEMASQSEEITTRFNAPQQVTAAQLEQITNPQITPKASVDNLAVMTAQTSPKLVAPSVTDLTAALHSEPKSVAQWQGLLPFDGKPIANNSSSLHSASSAPFWQEDVPLSQITPAFAANKAIPAQRQNQSDTVTFTTAQQADIDLSLAPTMDSSMDAESLELQQASLTQTSTRLAPQAATMMDPALVRSSVSAQRLAPELNERLSVMINTEQMSAELQLDPPELGALQVRIQMNGDQAQVQIQAQSVQARELLEQSLSQLKEMLEQQGIQLADANISDGSGQQTGEQEQGGERANEPVDEEDLRQMTGRNAAGGIDYYA